MRFFPLFLDLRGRPVLVVGGGAVAARKIALLAETGAALTVVAPELDPELEQAARQGNLRHEAREFVPADLAGKWLVIAATSSTDVNAAVAAAALAAGVFCNVVDDRLLSSFIVPAVINRSPVQIAVSTGGASPVLARLIRERLETLLDESLGTVASFADSWREAAKRRFPDTGPRRRFFSWLLTGPAAAAVRAHRIEAGDELARQALAAGDAARVPGQVALVGAGPGDPGLLTLKGLRALQEADVIVHDRLVSADVLALARRDAERIDVGKCVGGGATQEDINDILVARARRGEYVVRLKGGDPFVFGRGGEEIDNLRANDVAFEVVPGVTAAIAAGAYAGVPLTDRRLAQSVRLLTGNSSDWLTKFDFSDVAAGRETLALYMGAGNLPALYERLRAATVAPDMPVALIENASRPEQRVIVSQVSHMCRAAVTHNVRAPSVVLIGRVVENAAPRAWFGQPVIVHEQAA